MARIRAVEPQQLDQTALSVFLRRNDGNNLEPDYDRRGSCRSQQIPRSNA